MKQQRLRNTHASAFRKVSVTIPHELVEFAIEQSRATGHAGQLSSYLRTILANERAVKLRRFKHAEAA